jgi:hypothetical protein
MTEPAAQSALHIRDKDVLVRKARGRIDRPMFMRVTTYQ